MAGRIRQGDVEEVKSRTNIADIVGDYVSLKSAGVGSMKGLCPFHDERSPSFHVRPQVGLYHCFGCGESGDVYSFLQKMDHVTFAEAVERLAARLGYTLHFEDGGAQTEQGNRARLLAANAAAEEFFRDRLGTPEADVGRRFLGERGFDAHAAARFGVGFAPKSWDELTKHLRGRGFTPEELAASGLVSQGDRGVYDRFRGRLVWPIRDVTGQTVGFGARRLLDDDKGPKYLNTPETAVYHKAQVLYGLDLAKRDISRTNRVVVVEGYTDVMACHLAGVTTAVATCGTSFGVDHIKVLRRVLGDDSGLGEVVFTFDPDAAGQKAALRAFSEERRFAAQTFVAVGPEGLDPCDLRIRQGDDAVRRMIDTKKPMFEFVLRKVVARYDLETVEGRVAALREAAPVIADLRDPSLQPGYARELARMIGVELGEVHAAVRMVQRASERDARAGDPQAQRRDDSAHAGAAGRPAPARGGHPDEQESRRRTDGPTIGSLGSDPSTRLERDAVMAMLQHPESIGDVLIAQACATGFANPSLAVVRDAVAAAGCPDASSDWVARVSSHVPESFVTLVQQLAVAPIPERDENAVAPYVQGVVSALIDKGLLAQKTALLGRLQRADPTDRDAYNVIQRELLEIEAARRRVRGE